MFVVLGRDSSPPIEKGMAWKVKRVLAYFYRNQSVIRLTCDYLLGRWCIEPQLIWPRCEREGLT